MMHIKCQTWLLGLVLFLSLGLAHGQSPLLLPAGPDFTDPIFQPTVPLTDVQLEPNPRATREVLLRDWFRVEGLVGNAQGTWTPPLVSSSPAAIPAGTAGALGLPTTFINFGNERLGREFRPSLRVSGTHWFNTNGRGGVDFGAWMLTDSSTFFSAIAFPPGTVLPGTTPAAPTTTVTLPNNVQLPPGVQVPTGVRIPSGVNIPGVNVPNTTPTTTSTTTAAARNAQVGLPGVSVDANIARPILTPNGSVGIPVGGAFIGGVTASHGTTAGTFDLNYRRAWVTDPSFRFDMLAGYRYVHVGDYLDIWQTAPTNVANVLTQNFPQLAGFNSVIGVDTFRSRNNFHGGQFGFSAVYEPYDYVSLELTTKFGFGVTQSVNTVSGNIATVPGGQSLATGVLANASNIGRYTRQDFAFAPEINSAISYAVTDALRLTVGYNFLYLSKTVRAPEQIDLGILTTTGNPFRNITSDFWMQGLMLGMEVRY
ncbi:MAG: BBP7 family outer membrane beta-barrel protein [Fimbriiglobus sp.]